MDLEKQLSEQTANSNKLRVCCIFVMWLSDISDIHPEIYLCKIMRTQSHTMYDISLF